ncbi:MAG: YbhB/YbcL family Raf kinase inhibitor-like protein [Microbacterium sp.]|uniref:YbhB/YbcL family Raf kinase inhibitor-like protein n=1 Tax=Microbacterium sp. TaxID=51671 RepID=UPI0039E5EC31
MSYDPYAALPAVPALAVTSASFEDGARLPLAQVGGMLGTGGGDCSPHLAWSAVPQGTRSIAVTCFDPDAPTASGFWHWAVWGIPADTVELPEGAVVLDTLGAGLPTGASVLRNDAGFAGFVGAAPPPGHGDHRYMFVVHALDIDDLALDAAASPALLGFHMFGHTLARGRITGTFGH